MSGERVSLKTASARTLPACASGRPVVIDTIIMCASPLATAAMPALGPL